MKSRILKGAAIALTTIATLWTPAAMAQKTVRVQDYPGLGNFLLRVANANGLCEKNGIKCEARSTSSGPLGLQILMSGDIEIAFAATDSVIQLVNKGGDLKVIGSGARNPVFFLMAGTDMSLPNLSRGYPAVMQDFKGKKIGITARGAGPEFVLKEMLLDAGMKVDDVTLVAVGAPNTAFPAIANKQIDGLMLFTPMDGFCIVSKACTVVVDTRKGEGPLDIKKTLGASIISVVRGDYAEKNADAVNAYVKAMTEAETIAQNPANFGAMLKIASDTFKITSEGGDKVLEVALRNALPGYKFPVDPKAMQHIAVYNHQNGQIDKVVDNSKLLYKH